MEAGSHKWPSQGPASDAQEDDQGGPDAQGGAGKREKQAEAEGVTPTSGLMDTEGRGRGA